MNTLARTHTPAVRLIVHDIDGRILLLQRAPGSSAAGRWCLPGGKAEVGEDLYDTARRELEEETGLVGETVTYLFAQKSFGEGEVEGTWDVFYFQCIASGEVAIDAESSSFAWVHPSELGGYDLAFRNDEALARFRQLVLGNGRSALGPRAKLR
jgi:8-oxo-dGTP pyrophosphatase MutT (NUDIX family)